MVSIEEIKQRIAVANGESKRLNNERQVSIGKRDALTSQLKTLFAKYKEEYGIELTKDNVDSELQRVLSEKEKEVEQIENVLNLINSGNYTEAQKLVDGAEQSATQPVQETASSVQSPVEQTTTPPVQIPVEQTATPPVQTPAEQSVSQPSVPPVEQSVAQPSVPSVQSSVPTPPVQPAGVPQGVVPPSVTPPPSTPDVATPPTPPTPPAPPVNNTGIAALNGFSEPAGNVASPTQPTAEESKQTTSPTSFNAILSGTAFNPSN